MTETGCAGMLTKVTDVEKSDKHAYESIGTPGPFIEIKVIDPATNMTVPRNTDGELCVRSRCNMKKYWNDPEKTAETIDESGWLKTGDVNFRLYKYCVYRIIF